MVLQVMCVMVAWLAVSLAVGMIIGRSADFGNRPMAYSRATRRQLPDER